MLRPQSFLALKVFQGLGPRRSFRHLTPWAAPNYLLIVEADSPRRLLCGPAHLGGIYRPPGYHISSIGRTPRAQLSQSQFSSSRAQRHGLLGRRRQPNLQSELTALRIMGRISRGVLFGF